MRQSQDNTGKQDEAGLEVLRKNQKEKVPSTHEVPDVLLSFGLFHEQNLAGLVGNGSGKTFCVAMRRNLTLTGLNTDGTRGLTQGWCKVVPRCQLLTGLCFPVLDPFLLDSHLGSLSIHCLLGSVGGCPHN